MLKWQCVFFFNKKYKNAGQSLYIDFLLPSPLTYCFANQNLMPLLSRSEGVSLYWNNTLNNHTSEFDATLSSKTLKTSYFISHFVYKVLNINSYQLMWIFLIKLHRSQHNTWISGHKEDFWNYVSKFWWC
jgi:hypothetical protein